MATCISEGQNNYGTIKTVCNDYKGNWLYLSYKRSYNCTYPCHHTTRAQSNSSHRRWIHLQHAERHIQVIFFPNCNKLITEILSFIKADYVTSNKLLNAFINSNYSIMQKSNKWKFTVKRSTVPLGFFFLNKLNSPQVCKHRLPGMLLI